MWPCGLVTLVFYIRNSFTNNAIIFENCMSILSSKTVKLMSDSHLRDAINSFKKKANGYAMW